MRQGFKHVQFKIWTSVILIICASPTRNARFYEHEQMELTIGDYFMSFKEELILGPNSSFNFSVKVWVRLPSLASVPGFFNVFLDNLKFLQCDYDVLLSNHQVSNLNNTGFNLKIKNSTLYEKWFLLGVNFSQDDTGFTFKFWENGVINSAQGQYFFPDIKLLTLVFCTDVMTDNSNCQSDVILYDLNTGDFPLTTDLDRKRAVFLAYYPFYLYKDRFSRVPDFLRKGASPFLREKSENLANLIGLHNHLLYPYLHSRFSVGWLFSENFIRGNLPFAHKIFSVSFDVVSNFKTDLNSIFEYNLLEFGFKNELDQQVFQMEVRITLNISNNSFANRQFTGNLDLKYQYMLDGANLEAEQVQNYNIVFNQIPGTMELNNLESTDFNSSETKKKMFSFLSKQTLVFEVQLDKTSQSVDLKIHFGTNQNNQITKNLSLTIPAPNFNKLKFYLNLGTKADKFVSDPNFEDFGTQAFLRFLEVLYFDGNDITFETDIASGTDFLYVGSISDPNHYLITDSHETLFDRVLSTVPSQFAKLQFADIALDFKSKLTHSSNTAVGCAAELSSSQCLVCSIDYEFNPVDGVCNFCNDLYMPHGGFCLTATANTTASFQHGTRMRKEIGDTINEFCKVAGYNSGQVCVGGATPWAKNVLCNQNVFTTDISLVYFVRRHYYQLGLELYGLEDTFNFNIPSIVQMTYYNTLSTSYRVLTDFIDSYAPPGDMLYTYVDSGTFADASYTPTIFLGDMSPFVNVSTHNIITVFRTTTKQYTMAQLDTELTANEATNGGLGHINNIILVNEILMILGPSVSKRYAPASTVAGFFTLSGDDNIFVDCPERCADCNDSMECTVCPTGYYVHGTGAQSECVQCGYKCQTCTGAPESCIAVNPTEIIVTAPLPQTTLINPPQPISLDYTGKLLNCMTTYNDFCIQCIQGYKLKMQICVPDPDYLARNNLFCPKNCLTCDFSGNCLQCQMSFYLHNNQCFNCSDNCILCFTLQFCFKCDDNYFFDLTLKKCAEYELQNEFLMKNQIIGFAASSVIQTGNLFKELPEFPNIMTISKNCLLQNLIKGCIFCKPEYFTKNGICESCLVNCMNCYEDSTCKQCKKGFELGYNSDSNLEECKPIVKNKVEIIDDQCDKQNNNFEKCMYNNCALCIYCQKKEEFFCQNCPRCKRPLKIINVDSANYYLILFKTYIFLNYQSKLNAEFEEMTTKSAELSKITDLFRTSPNGIQILETDKITNYFLYFESFDLTKVKVRIANLIFNLFSFKKIFKQKDSICKERLFQLKIKIRPENVEYLIDSTIKKDVIIHVLIQLKCNTKASKYTKKELTDQIRNTVTIFTLSNLMTFVFLSFLNFKELMDVVIMLKGDMSERLTKYQGMVSLFECEKDTTLFDQSVSLRYRQSINSLFYTFQAEQPESKSINYAIITKFYIREEFFQSQVVCHNKINMMEIMCLLIFAFFNFLSLFYLCFKRYLDNRERKVPNLIKLVFTKLKMFVFFCLMSGYFENLFQILISLTLLKTQLFGLYSYVNCLFRSFFLIYPFMLIDLNKKMKDLNPKFLKDNTKKVLTKNARLNLAKNNKILEKKKSETQLVRLHVINLRDLETLLETEMDTDSNTVPDTNTVIKRMSTLKNDSQEECEILVENHSIWQDCNRKKHPNVVINYLKNVIIFSIMFNFYISKFSKCLMTLCIQLLYITLHLHWIKISNRENWMFFVQEIFYVFYLAILTKFIVEPTSEFNDSLFMIFYFLGNTLSIFFIFFNYFNKKLASIRKRKISFPNEAEKVDEESDEIKDISQNETDILVVTKPSDSNSSSNSCSLNSEVSGLIKTISRTLSEGSYESDESDEVDVQIRRLSFLKKTNNRSFNKSMIIRGKKVTKRLGFNMQHVEVSQRFLMNYFRRRQCDSIDVVPHNFFIQLEKLQIRKD